MAKYLVETYYNCTFKVSHYLDEVNNNELKNLEKRDDGTYEIIDIKLDNRKTKNLEKVNETPKANDKESENIDLISKIKTKTPTSNFSTNNKIADANHKRLGMPAYQNVHDRKD